MRASRLISQMASHLQLFSFSNSPFVVMLDLRIPE